MSAHRHHREHLRVLPRRPRLRLRVQHAVVHRLRAHVHARDPRALRPVRAGAWARGPTEKARPQRGQGGVHPDGRHVHESAVRLPRLVRAQPARRALRRELVVRRGRGRGVGAEPHEVRRFDHRDQAGLLPVPAPAADALVRVHAPRDWFTEHLRGRRARHEPRAHRQGRAEVLRARQGRGV